MWVGTTRRDVRAFPRDARRMAGVQLRRVQGGLEPLDWKPLAVVGSGVKEIRIHTATAHRVLYLAKFAEAIYVLHGFENRTRKTTQRDIQLARDRFTALLTWRREQTKTRG